VVVVVLNVKSCYGDFNKLYLSITDGIDRFCLCRPDRSLDI